MKRRLLLVIVGSFLLGSLIGVGALMLNQESPNKNRVITSGQALIGGPFELVGKDGKTVTDKDFRGRYMLVFFGFTHCPDICPAELQVMSAALDDLGDKADQVVPIFINIAPALSRKRTSARATNDARIDCGFFSGRNRNWRCWLFSGQCILR